MLLVQGLAVADSRTVVFDRIGGGPDLDETVRPYKLWSGIASAARITAERVNIITVLLNEHELLFGDHPRRLPEM